MLAKWELDSFEAVPFTVATICSQNSWGALGEGKGVLVSFLRKTLSTEKPQGKTILASKQTCGVCTWLPWLINNALLY